MSKPVQRLAATLRDCVDPPGKDGRTAELTVALTLFRGRLVVNRRTVKILLRHLETPPNLWRGASVPSPSRPTPNQASRGKSGSTGSMYG